MNDQFKIQERLEFYQNSYTGSKRELDSIRKKQAEVEKEFKKAAFNLVDEKLGETIDLEEKDFVEKKLGISLNELDKTYKKFEERRLFEVSEIEKKAAYKEYLNLIIEQDHQVAVTLEDDEMFNYLLKENFHNSSFRNEPYFEIGPFRYQPRYWKFKKFANKRAKELGFENYEEMFATWKNLRIKFKSLVEIPKEREVSLSEEKGIDILVMNNRKIKDVILEGERLEKDIEKIKQEILKIPEMYLKDLKDKIAGVLLYIEEDRLSVFEDIAIKQNVISIRKNLLSLNEKIGLLDERLNLIMNNITNVEKLLLAVEKGANIQASQLDRFYSNEDPAIPVFELIDDFDWNEIERAFAQKGIVLNKKENYSVVNNKITEIEKSDLLKKYNVQEGEVFIDESLVGQRYKQ